MSLTPINFKYDLTTIEPTLTATLVRHQACIDQLAQQKNITWDTLITPLDNLGDELTQFWSPFNHLHSVMNDDSLREVYNACLPKLSRYSTDVGQNNALFKAYQALHDNTDFATLSPGRKKIIENALRDFRLSGVALDDEKKARYKAIAERLSSLSTKFEEHLLDATKAWSKLITDETQLQGIPVERKIAMQETATRRELQGWLVTLDYPCYHDVITYADIRALREEIYAAYCTRASDQGLQGGQFDNTEIMAEILALRHERAKLLGFEHYSQLSLEPKMAKNAEEVMNFLRDLIVKVKPLAKKDLTALSDFAMSLAGNNFVLKSWDIAYYSEKLREQNYAVSDEMTRPYFPAPKVIAGLFSVLERLYGLTLVEKSVPTWHKDVTFYEIYDEQKKLIGGVYFDLYARENKRGGAWMDEAIVRRKTQNALQLPIAYLTCNFSAPTKENPALLTHTEVETLFHEFGHCLQHLLTQIEDMGVSGINGVPWDAVEFPSQFFEAWCWQPEGLQLISGHYQTGEPLPVDLVQKLIAAKNFQAALFLIRQLEFALFDMTLHSQSDTQHSAAEVLANIRAQVSIMPPPAYNRFENSFSHIFAGGYAAGYYSYLWAEVLARDAFSAFLKEGIFSRDLGEKFKNTVLAAGGSVEPEVLFEQFMGRAPDNDALLAYYDLM